MSRFFANPWTWRTKDAIKEWTLSMQRMGKVNAKTAAGYYDGMLRLIGDLSDCAVGNLREWTVNKTIRHRLSQPDKTASISEVKKYTTRLQSFLVWCIHSFPKEGRPESFPDAEDIDVPRASPGKSPDRVLSWDEMKCLFDSEPDKEYRLMWMAMGTVGLRVSTCLSLRFYWFYPVDKIVRIPAEHCKGRSDEVHPIPYAPFWNLLEEVRSAPGASTRSHVFPHRSYSAVYKYLQTALVRAKIVSTKDDPVTPHTFRRSYATLMFRESKDLGVVQTLLAHKSPVTTARYIKTPLVQAKAAAFEAFKGK